MSLRSLALLSLSLACVACAGDPEPAPQRETPSTEAPARKHGPLSGTWVRTLDDGGTYVFEVYDDTHTVRGELTDGLPTDCLSYVFDLERGEQGVLQGSSLVRFSEPDEGVPTSYSTAWKDARLEDDAVLVEQQWIQTDEFGDVVDQGWAEVRYEFTPYVSEEALREAWLEAVAQVEAPHLLTIVPDQAGIGMGVVDLRETRSGGTTAWGTMIVDETDEAWRVEVSGGPLHAHPALIEAVMGLTVHKQSGHVLAATVGLPGQAGDPVAISDHTVAREPELEPVEEEVTVKAGTYASHKAESAWGTSWVGVEGDVEGILLKWVGKDETGYELASLEATKVALSDGQTLDAQIATFTDGQRWTLTRHPIVCTFLPYSPGSSPAGRWGFLAHDLFLEDGTELRSEVIDVVDDAGPQLDWPPSEPMQDGAEPAEPMDEDEDEDEDADEPMDEDE